jgi:hypothetical protein
MTAGQKVVLFLVSVSTLVSALVMAVLFYTELMDYFSVKAFGSASLYLWCKYALMLVYVGVAVAAVGVLAARPWNDKNQTP